MKVKDITEKMKKYEELTIDLQNIEETIEKLENFSEESFEQDGEYQYKVVGNGWIVIQTIQKEAVYISHNVSKRIKGKMISLLKEERDTIKRVLEEMEV